MGKLLGRCGRAAESGGIFNASCMYCFDAMGQGQSFDMAVQGAKAGGFLEPDPSMDLDGWDTAMKTVIQANTYWDQAYTLADVAIQGICGLTQADMIDAKSRGEVWCMVGRAVQNPDGSLKLTAGPGTASGRSSRWPGHTGAIRCFGCRPERREGRCTTASVRRLPAHPEICI